MSEADSSRFGGEGRQTPLAVVHLELSKARRRTNGRADADTERECHNDHEPRLVPESADCVAEIGCDVAKDAAPCAGWRASPLWAMTSARTAGHYRSENLT